MPAEAAATTVALLLLVLLSGGTTLSAQGMTGDANTRTSFYSADGVREARCSTRSVCTCGACGHQTLAECRKDACGTSHQMRGELAANESIRG